MLESILALFGLTALPAVLPVGVGAIIRMLHSLGKLRMLCHRRGAGSAGSAAVEFAMTAPVLLVLALGVADYGALMTNSASLQGATRALAEYARGSAACTAGGIYLSNSSCVTGLNHLVSTLQSNDTSLSSASFSYPIANLSTAGANYCTCIDGNAVSCSPLGSCNVTGDTRVVQYIRISATQSFSPMFPVTNLPGLSPTTLFFPPSLSAQTTTRIQ